MVARKTNRLKGEGVKRFIIFAGQTYNTPGGWNDVYRKDDKIVSFDTLEEAQEGSPNPTGYSYDWVHVVDMQTGEIVFNK
jgi:hypothetical protein